MAKDKTGIEQENQTAMILAVWQRYQPMLEMAAKQLLSLSSEEGQYLARVLYLLESICPSPGLRLATRLHAIELDAVPHFSTHLSTGITLDDQAVFAAVQKLLAAVPERDQVNFWLALVVIWIMSVSLSEEVLEGEGIDSPALLQDEPRFREYLRSELMQRLTHMY